MKTELSVRKAVLSLIATLVLLVGAARAQSDFPNRPVNLIMPFPPGGAVDQAGRSIAQALSKVWKQSMVVNTRAGAGGGVGMAAAAAAPPDGYNLLATHMALLSLPETDLMFGRKSAFDRSSFTPLALLVADPMVIVVKADAPWKTYQQFVDDARRHPDTITYSSSGAYSPAHLPFEMLALAAGGIKLRHIAYAGGGPALTAVLGGHVAATASVPAVLVPQIRSGVVRALVITGAQRHALLPEVPTAIELGYKDFEFYLWVGLFAPVKTPEGTVQTIRRDIGRAIQDPDFVQNMVKLGTLIDYRDGAAFVEFLNKDAERINAAIKRIGKIE